MTNKIANMDRNARAACILGIIGLLTLIWLGTSRMLGNDEIVANPTLPIARYLVGEGAMKSELRLEVATTAEEQRRGLMARDTIGEADGMIFIRDGEPAFFWMRGTRIPLDIAYVSPKGVVTSVHTAAAYDEAMIPSKGPVSMVVEVPAGRSRFYGLHEGSTVTRINDKPAS